MVFLWCRQWGLSVHDAADVVQEVWTTVAMHLADFRRERPEDTFRGWLWTITRNKLRDRVRRWRNRACAVGGTDAQAEWPRFQTDCLIRRSKWPARRKP